MTEIVDYVLKDYNKAKTNNVFYHFRYHKSISVAELYKINDTIEIREQGGAGRMVFLLSSPQRTPSPEEGTDTEVLWLHSCKYNYMQIKAKFV